MQAMAHAQAVAGAAEAGNPDSYPFSTLSIWRDKMQTDITASGVGGPDYTLRLLLEQGKDVEQAVLGCLKDSLYDLHEGVVWGLLDPAFEEQQRQHLLNAAANELHTDKQLCLQLAREHNVLERYTAEVKRPINHTIADYERVGELKFGLLVWRANLRRDASLAEDPQEREKQFHEAYANALGMIKRCGSKSLQFWSAQQAGSAPTQESKQRLYQAAVQRVRNSLLELAEAQAVDRDGLQRLFRQLSDPQAVGVEEPEGDAGIDAGSAGTVHGDDPGVSVAAHKDRRGGSEESGSSTLGF